MSNEPYIKNKRITGYFNGNIENIKKDLIQNERKYDKWGAMDIPSSDPNDFTYQISEKLINQVSRVILENNQIGDFINSGDLDIIKFPVSRNTTTLDSMVPGIGKKYGLDKPLAFKFMNNGAPKLLIKKDMQYLKGNLDVGVFMDDNKKDENELLRIQIKDLEVDAVIEPAAEDNAILNIGWKRLSFGSAKLTKKNGDPISTDGSTTGIDDFLYAALEQMLPWA